ncbi:hypothetical protein FACS18942_04670 [Planctomycetales bacterium]|nr:hypothetical protein FACS18942_04670 [Planctomycetales bacterium]GHT35227.1 hypothetical protein FACS189427_04060 [Planctomycetales bacterium]
MPIFTFILPVFDGFYGLERTVESVLRSFLKEFCLIIVDCRSGMSGQTVETITGLAQNDSRIQYFRNETDFNFAPSISALLPQLISEYTSFVRCGDVISPYLTTLVKKAFETHQINNRSVDAVFFSPVETAELPESETQPPFTLPSLPKSVFNISDFAALGPLVKPYFFKNSVFWNKVCRTKFLVNKILGESVNSYLSAEEILSNQRLLHYRICILSDIAVEIPEPVYYQAGTSEQEKFSAAGYLEYLLQCRKFFDRHPFVNTFWDEYPELNAITAGFFLAELDTLLRHYYASEQDDEIGKQFAEIAAQLPKEQRQYYRRAVLPRTERLFVRNVLGLEETIPPEDILLEPVPIKPVEEGQRIKTVSRDVYSSNELFSILSWNVGDGFLAVNSLGYGEPLRIPSNLAKNSGIVLSARSPSSVMLHIKKRVSVSGIMNGTSSFFKNGWCRFFIYAEDQKIILGDLFGPLDQTPEIILEPGVYSFEIDSFIPALAEGHHSLWVISEVAADEKEKINSPPPASPQLFLQKYPKPDFSVSVCVYNKSQFINDTMKSIMSQTYENFRVVVSDNCSTDGTIPILKEWAKRDSRIVLLLNDKNIGIQGNGIRAGQYMRTKFCVWIDADDMISPYYLAVCKQVLNQTGANGVFFQVLFIDRNGKFIKGNTKFGEMRETVQDVSERAALFCRPAASDKMYFGAIDPRMRTAIPYTANAHLDVASNLRNLVLRDKFVIIPNALYYRRIYSDSITEQNNNPHQLDAVAVYQNCKANLIQWNLWTEYKEPFLRFKLNHLVWLYNHVTEDLRSPLITAVLNDMDTDERRFYRETKLAEQQREFSNKILGLSGVNPELNTFPVNLPFEYDTSASILQQETTDVYFSNEVLAVHSWQIGSHQTGQRIPGINGSGGISPLSLPKNIKLLTHTIISTGCPSMLKITLKQKAGITGFMNGTTPWLQNEACLFSLDGKRITQLYGPHDTTPEMLLEPGTYELKTSGLEPVQYKHSCWAVRALNR